MEAPYDVIYTFEEPDDGFLAAAGYVAILQSAFFSLEEYQWPTAIFNPRYRLIVRLDGKAYMLASAKSQGGIRAIYNRLVSWGSVLERLRTPQERFRAIEQAHVALERGRELPTLTPMTQAPPSPAPKPATPPPPVEEAKASSKVPPAKRGRKGKAGAEDDENGNMVATGRNRSRKAKNAEGDEDEVEEDAPTTPTRISKNSEEPKRSSRKAAKEKEEEVEEDGDSPTPRSRGRKTKMEKKEEADSAPAPAATQANKRSKRAVRANPRSKPVNTKRDQTAAEMSAKELEEVTEDITAARSASRLHALEENLSDSQREDLAPLIEAQKQRIALLTKCKGLTALQLLGMRHDETLSADQSALICELISERVRAEAEQMAREGHYELWMYKHALRKLANDDWFARYILPVVDSLLAEKAYAFLQSCVSVDEAWKFLSAVVRTNDPTEQMVIPSVYCTIVHLLFGNDAVNQRTALSALVATNQHPSAAAYFTPILAKLTPPPVPSRGDNVPQLPPRDMFLSSIPFSVSVAETGPVIPSSSASSITSTGAPATASSSAPPPPPPLPPASKLNPALAVLDSVKVIDIPPAEIVATFTAATALPAAKARSTTPLTSVDDKVSALKVYASSDPANFGVIAIKLCPFASEVTTQHTDRYELAALCIPSALFGAAFRQACTCLREKTLQRIRKDGYPRQLVLLLSIDAAPSLLTLSSEEQNILAQPPFKRCPGTKFEYRYLLDNDCVVSHADLMIKAVSKRRKAIENSDDEK